MNKIYKVIWSKVRNCYVAVSEIAKRNGKGCGAVVGGAAVNCGAKGKSGRIMSSLHKAGRLSGSLWAPRYVAAALALAALCTVPGHAMANSGGHVDGDSYRGDPPDYTVVIDEDFNGNVYGRYGSESTAAENATVTISGGAVDADVVGGYIYGKTGSATGNTVNMSGGTVYAVYGGHVFSPSYFGSGNATGNTVSISGGEVGAVYGGCSNVGSATGNTVNMSGGAVKEMYGGHASGDAINNIVEFSKGQISTGSLYGGYASGTGAAKSNTVEIKGGTVEAGSVYGGYSNSGTAGGENAGEGNKVIFNVAEGAADGFVTGSVYGGYSGSGSVTGNSIEGNRAVVINLYGGYVAGGSGAASRNSINVNKADGDYVVGGYAGGTGEANYNKVSLGEGSMMNYYVAGGYSFSGAAANNNDVTIKGGTVTKNVYGGYAANGDAKNNTVSISDSNLLEGNLYGGYGTGDVVTGNTLVISGSNDVSFDSTEGHVKNFKTIKLADDLKWSDGATVLAANQFDTNADGTRASLDVTNATKDGSEFVKTAADGQMTLLASETADDFATLGLVYSGGSETLNASKQSQVVKDEEFTDADKGVTVTAQAVHTVSLDAENSYKNVLYAVENTPKGISLGAMTWGEGRDLAGKYTFDDTITIDATDLSFSGTATTALKKDDSAVLVSNATGITADNGVTQPGTGKGTVAVDYTDAAGINFAATASGHVAAVKDAVNYMVDGVAVNSVNLAGWNGTTSAVPDGWTAGGATSGTSGGVTPETEGSVTPETEDPAGGLTVETDGMTVPEVEAGKHIDILQANTAGFFTGASINGANTYKTTAFTESDPAQSVTIAGSQGKGVTLNEEKNHIIYASGIKDVDTVTLGRADFAKDAVLFDRSSTGYNYAKVKALGVDNFAVAYDKPETVAAGDTMTLLKANKTLADMAAQTKTNSYEYEPVTGVKVNAAVTGSLAAKGGAVTYRAEENRAGKLTFTDVDWKDSGALLTRPSNIVFAGADVDTAKIHFKNIESLQAKKKMTLVSDFGDSVGTITGNKYTVGTGLEGEGAASLAGSDLIFTAKTGTGNLQPQEQAHKAVMAMEAGIAMLAAGSEHVGMALGGLAAQGNGGPDGTSTFASVGGGASRYETGSHVNTNTWNALVAVGGKKELEKGTLQYGLFGEYGKGNYTLHSSAGRSDGDAYYAGGGLLAKWTNKHNVYAEASFRLGRMSDTASDILHDAAGNGYGYDVHANYYGGHVGFGKVFIYKGGRSLDIYGKYFYTKRDGVNFTAGGSAYDLDSVASSVLRVGARYGTTDRKWNWYGGLAYDYEFDGEAAGKVDGVSIRSASVKGGSVRGELGLRMDATKDNPWKADISVYGYGGKHRGFGGNVSVAYTF